MSENKQYVHLDPDGTYRITDKRVSLDSVVYPFRNGDSAESIRSQYPALTLEDVYGAVAFYLANKAEVDAYLIRREGEWEELRQEYEKNLPPVVIRLREMKRAQVEEKA